MSYRYSESHSPGLGGCRRDTPTGSPRQPGRMVFDFVGTFICEPTEDGTIKVTHSYDFRFKGPFKVLEKPLAGWLQAQVTDEVGQIRNIFAKP